VTIDEFCSCCKKLMEQKSIPLTKDIAWIDISYPYLHKDKLVIGIDVELNDDGDLTVT
jgi:hypothetical protein